MTRPTVPSLLVEKLAAGELSADKAEEVRARLAEAGELDRLTDLQRDNEQMLAHITPAMVRRQVERRVAEQRKRSRRRATGWVGILALAGVLGAIAVPQLRPEHTPVEMLEADPGNRIKGLQPELRVYLQTDDGPVQLTEGASVSEGDLIQLSYVAAGKPYGAILSVDGAFEVTLHTPVESSELNPSGEQFLEFSYQLDDAPDHETFYFVTSDEPLNPGYLRRRLEDTRPEAVQPFIFSDRGAPKSTYILRLRKEAE